MANVAGTVTREQTAWIAQVAQAFDAVVFWTVGRYGSQPLLLPRHLWTVKR